MPLGLGFRALAVELARVGQVRMALFVMVSVSTYCRPSEPLALPTSSLIPPSQGIFDEWALLVAPQELPPALSSLGQQVLEAVGRHVLESLEASAPDRQAVGLQLFNYSQYLSSFKAACASLKIQLTPYQTRHNGPSIDRAQNNRLVFEVQKRGNRKCHSLLKGTLLRGSVSHALNPKP